LEKTYTISPDPAAIGREIKMGDVHGHNSFTLERLCDQASEADTQ
jgi:hypothetical protein